MTDIVERLRKRTSGNVFSTIDHEIMTEAADEIARLRAEYTTTLVHLRTLETECFKLRSIVSVLTASGANLLAEARNALEKELPTSRPWHSLHKT